MLKILFLGDVYGEPGRHATRKYLPEIKARFEPDLTIVNIENMTHGKGFSPEHVEDMQSVGGDFFTSGNHAWKTQSGVDKMNQKHFPVLRPANFPPGAPGRGYEIVTTKTKKRVLVINLQGRVFMREHTDCPFRTFDEIFEKTKKEKLDAIFVDLHAEATSEKNAFGRYVDGRASIVVGTHTHVPTRDEQIFPKGTAFISDVGFVGPKESIIGADIESVLTQFLTQVGKIHEVAKSNAVVFNAIYTEIDEKTKKAQHIEHIQYGYKEN